MPGTVLNIHKATGGAVIVEGMRYNSCLLLRLSTMVSSSEITLPMGSPVCLSDIENLCSLKREALLFPMSNFLDLLNLCLTIETMFSNRRKCVYSPCTCECRGSYLMPLLPLPSVADMY